MKKEKRTAVKLSNFNPNKLKSLNNLELKALSKNIRREIMRIVEKSGGHLSPNLGIVELTVGLHYVFNSPIDKIIFDTSHQSYVHQILTGRLDDLYELHKKSNGFTNKDKSEHDFFSLGHTSTSISLASGFQAARDLSGGKENIIAVIGDGALSGGIAFEALNFVGKTKSNLIVILNDNQMSISKTNGFLYEHLKTLRNNPNSKNNLFKAFGFDYKYVKNGNDITSVITALKSIKDINHPIVLHVSTKKGLGHNLSEKKPDAYHEILPKGITFKKIHDTNDNYEVELQKLLTNEMENDKNLSISFAGVPMYFDYWENFKNPIFDVDISEQHLIAFSSAYSLYNKNSKNKILTLVRSTFIGRAYDQIAQEASLNNAPAKIIITNAGISSSSHSHLGIFDVSMFYSIPNIVLMEPANKNDLKKMFKFLLQYNKGPCILRLGNMGIDVNTGDKFIGKSKLNIGKSEIVYGDLSKKIIILSFGSFINKSLLVAEKLLNEHNLESCIVNMRFFRPLDKELIKRLNNKIVVTLENSTITAGLYICKLLHSSNNKVINFGAKNEFTNNVGMDDIENDNDLKLEKIIHKILEYAKK